MHTNGTTTRTRILIVGSDMARVNALRVALTVAGYLVRFSGSGQDALEQSRAWRPEIVIAEGKLADIEVSVFCTILRSSGSTSSILVRSKQRRNVVELLDAGADDCIDTDCSIAELKARLRSKLQKVNYQDAAAFHAFRE